MNIDKFSTAPSAVLTEIPQPKEAVETETKPAPGPSQSPPIIAAANVEEQILAGTKHTKVSSLLPGDGATSPATAGGPGQPPGVGSSVALGAMIEGKLAIELMDALLPGLFVAALYAVNIKLRKTELQLTEKEKGTIAPIMQQCLNTIMLNFSSPWQTLGVTLAVIYGSKVSEKGVVAWIDKMNEKKEKELNAPAVTDPTPLPSETVKADRLANQTGAEILTKPPYTMRDVERFKKEKRVGIDRAILALNKKFNLPTHYKPAA